MRSNRGPWLRFGGGPVLGIVRQSSTTECGLACVAMLANFHGIATDLSWLRRKFEVSLKGATLADINHCCAQLGLTTRAVRCSYEEMENLSLPCILHWRFSHFVVLKSVTENGIVVHDPARGVVTETAATCRDAFTGVALEVAPVSKMARSVPPRALKLTSLISRDAAILRKFLAGMLLALVCELLLVATPLYLQVVIDHVLAKNDDMLLRAVSLVFLALLLLHVAANVMRQLTFLFLGHVTVFDITSRVFHRLVSLPVRFFKSRELGDIQHRIQSMNRIQSFLVQSVPALVLDALFVILISLVMALYDPQLTGMMFLCLALWCAWRVMIFSYSLRMSSDIAQSESRVQTYFLETLRAVQSIKLSNGEAQRESEWKNRFADAINTRIRLGNLQVVDAALRQFLFQGARIGAIYWLASKGLAAEMSIGSISALVAYLGMFSTRCSGIVDRITEYKLLQVPLTRVADIIFSEEEAAGGACDKARIGEVELRNMRFSYTQREPAILAGCDARIEESSLTAIVGSSGSGKSTLLQIIAGNEAPCSGELLLGGRSSQQLNLAYRRSQTAAVLQGDGLLKGSIAENIGLFAPEIDIDRVRAAALTACISADIETLPMAYETRIGDLGSSMSRGQVQRILLARALYRRSPLLLLDEATSGLDPALERRVIESIRQLPATKIVVTHSDLMLQAADAVLWLHKGRLLSSRPDLNA